MKCWRSVFILVIMLAVSASLVNAESAGCPDGGDCANLAQSAAPPALTDDEMLAYSVDFEQLRVDTSRLHDRRYVQVEGEVSIHDAPNGAVLRHLHEGFNFFTVMSVHNDWTQISPNEWVHSSHLTDSNAVISHFTGIFLPEELPQYTPAWMLINAYPSREPGGPPRESNRLHYRYTMVNIFATVEVDGWRWYQIGPEKWVKQTYVAKVEPIERPESVETERWIGIDLYEQTLIVYEGEQPIFATLIASGMERWPTLEGTFNVYFRRARKDMTWGVPGDNFYYLQEVPWTMYYDEGRALHGTYWHDGFGYRRSRGCVNMSITDAHWLYHWIAEEMGSVNSPDVEVGPAVFVYSSDEYR
jgi:lipoprotein-anchoring transpeptidase ErfK/SrfK